MKLNKVKNFIRNHAQEEFPKECCGFIVEKDEDFIPIRCENTALIPLIDFKIKTSDYLSIKEEYNIRYIYHSHCDQRSQDFSINDISSSDAIGISYLLHIANTNIFKIYEADTFSKKYIGRIYEYKKYDCFSLITDFIKNEFSIELDKNLIYNFFEKNGNIYSDLTDVTKDFFLNSGKFKLINNIYDLRKNDILLMRNHLNKPCHFSIYMGNSKILHHTIDRFSMVQEYSDRLKTKTHLIFRLN